MLRVLSIKNGGVRGSNDGGEVIGTLHHEFTPPRVMLPATANHKLQKRSRFRACTSTDDIACNDKVNESREVRNIEGVMRNPSV